jgi:hypothetical protein
LKKGNISSAGTILTSFFAASCCIGPALFIITGTSVGFLSRFSFLEPATPYMLVIAFLMLGYSFWKLYVKKPDCDCDQDVRTRKIARTIFWIAFTSLLIAASFQKVVLWIYS